MSSLTAAQREKIDAFRPGVYRHYKGDLYLVIGVAWDTTDGCDELPKQIKRVQVIYVPLYNTDGVGIKIYRRDFEEFTGMVFKGNGVPCPRFTPQGNGAFL